MVGAILILLVLPFMDSSRIRGFRFRPIMRVLYWLFIVNFLLLLWIGAQAVEEPYIMIGRVLTIFYFGYFLIIPFIGYLEDILSYYDRVRGSDKKGRGGVIL